MPTINYKEKSLLEIAIEVVRSHNKPQPIMQIAKETMELKGLKSTQGQQALPQFLADFMESGYFVFCGDGMWDLKERQPLSVLDKDGSDYEMFAEDAEEVAANELKSEEDYYNETEKEVNEEDDIDDEEEDDDISSILKETESKSYAEETEVSSEEAVTGYEEDEEEEDQEEDLGEEDLYEKASNLDF